MDAGLFEALPDAILVVDGEGRIVHANANAHLLFGHPAGGLVGLGVEVLMPEAVRARHREHRIAYAVAPRMRPMGAGGMSLVGQRRTGEQFPVEIALAPLDDGSGKREFLASIRDISETLRARQALQRSRYDRVIADLGQEALGARTAEAFIDCVSARLSVVMGGDAMVGLWLRDADGASRWASVSHPAVRRISPAVIARFATQAFRVFVRDDPPPGAASDLFEEGPFHACAFAPLVERETVAGALVALSSHLSHFDHDTQHLLQSAATLVAAVIQRSSTEEQLAHAQRLDSLGQLTGGIAHDFNNLLTVMSGSLQLLAAEQATPESIALIESALRAVRRGADLTDKLLSFGRRKQLRPAPIDACRLMGDIRVLLERTLSDNVRVTVEVAEGIPPAFADASQLDSALVNLALNARDAMPDGGSITLRVEEKWVAAGARAIAGLAPGHYIVYSVADTGLGMTPEVQARAIEPFFSTKRGRGNGLGLSMVYGFVQQSGGGMSINSAQAAGTRISLYLPVASQGVQERTTHRTAAAACGTVLIVEDDPEVRSIASAFVRSLGYGIVEVPDHESAIARLSQESNGIDLVFTDLMLGAGPDGAALAARVCERWPSIGVVVTSGHAHGLDLDSSALEILPKPYDREQLAAALARCRAATTRTT